MTIDPIITIREDTPLRDILIKNFDYLTQQGDFEKTIEPVTGDIKYIPTTQGSKKLLQARREVRD